PQSRLPDATPTSTAPPSPVRRNKGWIAAQIVFTAAVLWYLGTALVRQWRAARGVSLVVELNWALLAASCGVVLLTYAVLIETLRRLIMLWDMSSSRLSFFTMARIWCVSNLGKYVPGKVWGIGVMAAMSRQAGVNPVTAAGASVLNVIVNIATGFLVALVAG